MASVSSVWPSPCHSQRPYVNPALARRQGRQIRSVRRQRSQRNRLEDRPDLPSRAEIGEVQAMRKDLHLISLARPGDLLPALAKAGELGHAIADHVLHVEFGSLALLAADDQCRSADILHPSVFHPEFFGVPRIDRDGGGNVPEHRVNQRKAGLVFFDRGHRLAFKRGVHQRELPAWRRLPRDDSVLPAIEVKVFGFVAPVMNAAQAGADPKIHVRQIRVLGIAGAHANRARVAVLNLQVDIAHRRIERARRRHRAAC